MYLSSHTLLPVSSTESIIKPKNSNMFTLRERSIFVHTITQRYVTVCSVVGRTVRDKQALLLREVPSRLQHPYPSKLSPVLINQPVIEGNSNCAPGCDTKEIYFIHIRTSALIAEIRLSVTAIAVRYGSL
jgi:hypothetical protein